MYKNIFKINVLNFLKCKNVSQASHEEIFKVVGELNGVTTKSFLAEKKQSFIYFHLIIGNEDLSRVSEWE